MDNYTIKDGFMGQKMIVLPESIRADLKTNIITKNFYITDIGYYPKANFHHRTRKKGADEFILIYCTEGQGQIIINMRLCHSIVVGSNSLIKYFIF